MSAPNVSAQLERICGKIDDVRAVQADHTKVLGKMGTDVAVLKERSEQHEKRIDDVKDDVKSAVKGQAQRFGGVGGAVGGGAVGGLILIIMKLLGIGAQ